jgi:hypothetical protein
MDLLEVDHRKRTKRKKRKIINNGVSYGSI